MTQQIRKFPQAVLALILFAAALLCLSACDRAQPTTYKIPKEVRAATLPMPDTDTLSATAPSNMEVLPGMQEAANKAGEIGYTKPAGWQEVAASGIRKANFKVADESGSAEITVLTFPGDVGGRLANINRWRGQIGLADAALDDLPAYTVGIDIANHRALYVRLEGETQSILGALLPFHGNTWFFKMLGDTNTVLANETAMLDFLNSIVLEDHAH
jgi:hypothetical protein